MLLEAAPESDFTVFNPNDYPDPVPAVEELKQRNQWVAWKFVQRGEGKPTKPPVDPNTGRGASHSNPATWASHAKAEWRAKVSNLAGVGFVLSEDDEYTGVDLDRCVDEISGRIEPWVIEILELQETYAEFSPSGTGIRMFVRGKVEKATKCDKAGVEIYGREGYMTVTGKHIDDTPDDIRPAPKTLAALLARCEAFRPKDAPAPAVPSHPERFIQGSDDVGARAWAQKALDGKAAAMAATGEGGRDNCLNDSSYGMGTIIARGWIEQSPVFAAFEDACRANGYMKEAGLKTVRSKIKRAIEAGMGKPHPDLLDRGDDQGLDDWMAMVDRMVDAEDRKRELLAIDGVEIDAETGEVVESQPGETGGNQEPRAAPVPRTDKKPSVEVEIVVASSFAGKRVPEQEWHVEGVIPKGNVAMLGGDGATGKSLLGLQLAVATATATPWIGLPTQAGKAIFVSAEDEIDEVHRRLARIHPCLEELDNLAIVPLAGKDAILAAPEGASGLLKETSLFKAIRHIIARHRPELLVLDTLADLFGGDEIKKVQARQFIALLRGLALEYGVTVVLLSHPSQSGMDSGAGTSGNTAWNNSVRARLYLERRITRDQDRTKYEEDPNIRILTTKKSNRSASGGQIVLRYDDGVFVREEESTLNAQDAAHHADRVFLKLLAQFEREGRTVSDKPGSNYAPVIFSKHPDANGASKAQLEKSMHRLFRDARINVEETGSPSRRQRKIVISPPPISDLDGYYDDAERVDE